MSFRSLSFRPLGLRQSSITQRSTLTHVRPFTYTHNSLYPRKDAQDKDSIDTNASEYTKSGSDDGAAQLDDTAFNSDITSPEGQEENAGKKADGTVSRCV